MKTELMLKSRREVEGSVLEEEELGSMATWRMLWDQGGVRFQLSCRLKLWELQPRVSSLWG